jgi:hypothetical protein
MIDLETLGVDPRTAPIIQIGAVAFELDEDGPKEAIPLFSELVTVRSNLLPPFCRELNPETVAWWADTDPSLLVKLMRGQGVTLTTALANLGLWFIRIDDGIEGVWANGPTFDITMLESAYQQEGMRVPWDFRTIRDMRTMAMIAGDDDACWTGGEITAIEREGDKHNALVDCLRQIRMVQQTWKRRIMPMPVVKALDEMEGKDA